MIIKEKQEMYIFDPVKLSTDAPALQVRLKLIEKTRSMLGNDSIKKIILSRNSAH
jgi:hypothetical protein